MEITDIVILKYRENVTDEEKLKINGFAQKNNAVGHIKPIPKNWRLEGDEAYSFYDRAIATMFLRYAYSYWKFKAVDSAIVISNEELERRKFQRRGLLERLFGGKTKWQDK